MKKAMKIPLNILKWLCILLAAAVIAVLFAHFVGGRIYDAVPEGGINEQMFVDINGTKQWISIYGQDRNNPVLLYLHGGPGSSTSAFDYVFTRKWADVYTVVTWDQRNCGKSYSPEQNGTVLTKEIFLQDGKEMTEFIRKYLGKEKITILGHSWGTFFGANLALEYPEYYDCYIGTGQLVDVMENEEAFKEEAQKWAEGDPEAMELVGKLTVGDFTMEHISARNALMDKFGYGMMADGTDYNTAAAIIFNPYYTLGDWTRYFGQDMGVYLDFFNSEEMFCFSLKNRLNYEMPYFNINGDRDYQTNFKLAQEYFDSITAPRKEMYIMKDTTHGLLESKSEEFSKILHEIAENMRQADVS